ncbi:MAG TPA: N-acetyltransferase [Lentisphaeria bacterium]|nr:N-acetyltransferase [Lentisphaeria bacterium]
MLNLKLRPLQENDAAAIDRILRQTGMFTAAEIDVANELIDIYLHKPDQKDYVIVAAVEQSADAEPVGYVCFGPTPATEATFDLYWIAVAPTRQGQGIGQALLNHAEQESVRRGGRLMIIETSSKAIYLPTQKFYEHNGYVVEARIRDFYAQGDDRLIYTRRFS